MQSKPIKKIVIIGPESTGKSTLCSQLAAHYNSVWCPEYAREYLLKYGTDYTFDDLLEIAKGQIELEEKTLKSVASTKENEHLSFLPVFIDTDMHVMKVWCEFVFGRCHRFILDEILRREYDLYLLANIDLEWVKDELREYPDLVTRKKLYNIYKDILINQTIPWKEISGNHEERLANAIAVVNPLLFK